MNSMKIDIFSNTIEVDFAFKITELFLEMEKKTWSLTLDPIFRLKDINCEDIVCLMKFYTLKWFTVELNSSLFQQFNRLSVNHWCDNFIRLKP